MASNHPKKRYFSNFASFLNQLGPNLAPTWAPRPLQKHLKIHYKTRVISRASREPFYAPKTLQHKPVLIRNGKRVIFSELPAASCCVWRVIAPLASLAALARSLRSRNLKNIFQNLSKILLRWPLTPPKINAKTLQKSCLERHFGCHFGALGGSQHKPRFFTLFWTLFFDLGLVLEPSWAPSWSQVGTQKAPHKLQKSITKMI